MTLKDRISEKVIQESELEKEIINNIGCNILDMVYYSKYPFSHEAEEKLKSMSMLKMPLDQIYDTSFGKQIFELAIKRIRCAILDEPYSHKNNIKFD